jgi:hypothetical protein
VLEQLFAAFRVACCGIWQKHCLSKWRRFFLMRRLVAFVLHFTFHDVTRPVGDRRRDLGFFDVLRQSAIPWLRG